MSVAVGRLCISNGTLVDGSPQNVQVVRTKLILSTDLEFDNCHSPEEAYAYSSGMLGVSLCDTLLALKVLVGRKAPENTGVSPIFLESLVWVAGLLPSRLFN